jgi:hypothetical protein
VDVIVNARKICNTVCWRQHPSPQFFISNIDEGEVAPLVAREGGGRFSLGSTVCLFNLHTHSGIRTVSKHLELGCGVSKYFTWIWTSIQVSEYFTITNTIRFLLINLLYNSKNWIHALFFELHYHASQLLLLKRTRLVFGHPYKTFKKLQFDECSYFI